MSEKLPKKILLLASNPLETGRLRLDEERREIKEALQKASEREQFVIESVSAVRYRDLNRAILTIEPNIVHFSGHGIGTELKEGEDSNSRKLVFDVLQSDQGGLIVEDESRRVTLVSTKAVADLFKLFADTVECVVINACFSHVQAKAIAEYIPYVVGMGTAIGDRAAIEFAKAFYDALGAGKSYEWAFKYACTAIDLAGIPESNTPKLFQKPSPRSPSLRGSDSHNKKDKIEPIIEKFISGNIVPFLGPGINPNFYIDLAPRLVPLIKKYLNGNISSEENWIPELIGIPCQNCPYLERPAECPMLKGIEAESSCSLYKQLLDKEQTLAVARMNQRYISQYFNLKDNPNDFYYKLREIFKEIKSNCPNEIHKLFAELPGLMKLKGYPKYYKGLPYPMIITTNYDNLLERAFDEVGQEYDVLYYVANGKEGKFTHTGIEEAIVTKDYVNLPVRQPWGSLDKPRPIILKLYGTLEDQFVMTQDQLNCLASGAIKQLPNILKTIISGPKGISILFLGYSPSDSELQLVFSQIWSENKLPKSSFMVHQSKPGKLEQEIWQQQGLELIEFDRSLEDFASYLETKIEEKINKKF